MRMHAAEVVLIILIVAAWAGAVALFLNRWGRIRIVQQRDFNYRHKPKNLDQVKIVKRPTESVIYRTYSTSMANTIEAREKRLERMRTMPNIKVCMFCRFFCFNIISNLFIYTQTIQNCTLIEHF
jgi:hypothetical protein